MNYTYLWLALGALTMFTLGFLFRKVVENIEDDQIRAQNRRDRELAYKIDERILSFNYHDRIVSLNQAARTMQHAISKLEQRIGAAKEELKEDDPIVAGRSSTVITDNIKSHKVIYKGIELIEYLENIEKEIEEVKSGLESLNNTNIGGR